MSKTIDLSNPKKLSKDDIQYLAERGQLPEGVPNPIKDPNRPALGDMVHTGDANTLAITTEELEAELARRRDEEGAQAKKNLKIDREALRREKAGVLSAQEDEDEEDDAPKPYTYGDKNDEELRALLVERGLDAEGARKTLRRRLRDDDVSKEG